MFGLFRPKQPLETREKAWIEFRLRWLAAEFGDEVLRGVEAIRPKDLSIPAGFRGTEEEVRRVADLICPRFRISPETVVLQVVPDHEIPGAGGTWQASESGSLIRMSETTCREPSTLIAVLAHELAHARLLGDGRIGAEEADHELLTDLLATAFGFGIFGANATITERFEQNGQWHHWEIGRRGYLTAREIGYALAVLAWVRGDRTVEWSRDLRLDARDTFRAGLRYLHRTGDSLVRPDDVGRPITSRSISATIDDLRYGTPTFRLAALWEVESAGPAEARIVEAVSSRIQDSDRSVRVAAARALGSIAPDDAGVHDDLCHLLGDREMIVRIAAAEGLTRASSLPTERAGELDGLLSSSHPALWDAAARVLARMGPAAEAQAPRMVDALIDSLIDCRDESAAILIEAIACITNDPERFLGEHLGRRDKELARRGIAILRQLRTEPVSR